MVMDESYLPDIHDFTAASYWLATFLIVCVTVVFFVKSIFLQRAQLACRWDSIIAYFTYIPILGHLIVYITYAKFGGFNEGARIWDLTPTKRDSDEDYDASQIFTVYFRADAWFMGLYYLAVFLVKLSLLLLYFRAFSSPAVSIRKRLSGLFGALIIGNIFLLVVWTTFVTWFWLAEEGFIGAGFVAVMGMRGAIAVGWMNSFTDLCLLAVPLYAMHRLQLRRKDKISIYGILLLGLVAAATSAIRSAFALERGYSTTMTWASYNFARFTSCMVEACLGYICFCLPAFRGLAEPLVGWVVGIRGAWRSVRRLGKRSADGRIGVLPVGPANGRRVRGEQSSQIELIGWGRR